MAEYLTRAQEFISIVNLIAEPPATPAEEDFMSFLGAQAPELQGVLSMRVFTPGESRAVPKEFAFTIHERAKKLLTGLPITGSYADHILEVIDAQTGSGEMRMLGPDYILSQCGIDRSEEGQVGIFDPANAPAIERSILLANYPNPYFIEELAQEHNGKMDRWVEAYTNKHGHNPLEEQ